MGFTGSQPGQPCVSGLGYNISWASLFRTLPLRLFQLLPLSGKSQACHVPNLSHSSHPCIIHTQYKDRKLRTEEQEEEEARVVSHKKKWHFRHSLWVGFQQPYPTRSLLLSLSSIQSMHLGYMLLSIMAFMYSILHDFFQLDLPHSIDVPRFAAFTSCNSISACSRETAFDEESKIPI